MAEKNQYTYNFPRPMVTVDVVVLRVDHQPEVLLIRRNHGPFEGEWALPGGFMEMDETLEEAARRELEEETGIKAGELLRFDTYDAVERDPRGRSITQVFVLIWKEGMGNPVAGSDAGEVAWFDLMQPPAFAFDHGMIVKDVVAMIRTPGE
jgi:8-oxo-dGTP diphosphatase